MSQAFERDGVTLYCGDCLDILPELEEGSVDAVVTDPPYGIREKMGVLRTRAGYGDGRATGVRTLQFPWDGDGVQSVVCKGLGLAFGLCSKDAACSIWTGFDSANAYAEVARKAGFRVKPMAWVKKCPPPAGCGNHWPSAFELGFYATRGKAWFGDDDVRRRNVWTYDSYRHGQPGKVDHPTQKPLRMIAHHVRAWVPPHGLCLDPFMGSGTTGVACVQMGRRFIGVEREAKYVDIAVRRIEAAMDETPLFSLSEQE